MNIKDYTNVQLIALIAAAAAELHARERKSPEVLTAADRLTPAAPATSADAIPCPSHVEQQHIADCMYIYKKKNFVRADDLREYRRIAKLFPGWMTRKRYPEDLRGSTAVRWAEKQNSKMDKFS